MNSGLRREMRKLRQTISPPKCEGCGGLVGCGPNDTWEILFVDDFIENYGYEPEGPVVCEVCGYLIDYGAPLDGRGGFRHTYIFPSTALS